MSWTVIIPKRVKKGIVKCSMPKTVQDSLDLLLLEIEVDGPVRGNWKNYSKLSKHQHHCHIGRGMKWVACWEVLDKKIKLIEVYYAGTRKDVPY